MKFKVGDIVSVNSNYDQEGIPGKTGEVFKIWAGVRYPFYVNLKGEDTVYLFDEHELDLVTPEAPSNGAI